MRTEGFNQNLDEEQEQKAKTYAEMSKDERQEFREKKEGELEELKNFFMKYGIPVKGTETEITTEGKVMGVEFSDKEKERFEQFMPFLMAFGVPVKGTETEIIIEGKTVGVDFSLKEGKEGLKLIIEQKYGEERINGLGRDKKEKSNWMCLNQEWVELTEEQKEIAESAEVYIKEVEDEKGDNKYLSKFVKENGRWDANQVLALGIDFHGIEIGEAEGGENIVKIRILPGHPVIELAKFLGKIDKVDLRGDFNSWCEKEKEERNKGKEIKGNLKEVNGGLECEIEWDGSPAQCKIAILDIEGGWVDNEWADGLQRMEIDLESE